MLTAQVPPWRGFCRRRGGRCTRFSPENIAANLVLVDRVRALAEEKGVTPGQVALAWVMSHGVVPIPGTKRRKYLDENAAAADVSLSEADLARLGAAVPHTAVAGDRDTPAGPAKTNG